MFTREQGREREIKDGIFFMEVAADVFKALAGAALAVLVVWGATVAIFSLVAG